MRRIFVDTLFLIASTYPYDRWHEAAKRLQSELGRGFVLVTTHEVLTELLPGMAHTGPYYRECAVRVAWRICQGTYMQLIPQSPELYRRGLERYEARRDKAYSLVDCISMVVSQDEGITEILTNDHHFEQEGFTILVRDNR